MRILYLVHRTPYPPNRGHRIRSFHWLRFLAARAEVDLAFLAESSPDADTLEALKKLCAQVAAVSVEPIVRWFRAAWSLGTGRTATEGLFRSPRLFDTVRRWSEQRRYDAAIAYCSSMVPYLGVPGLQGVPAVVDLVDVDSQKWLDYAQHAWGPKRWLFAAEGRRLRALERAVSRWAQAVVLVSPEEAELYRRFCPVGRVEAIGNGVDLEYFRPGQVTSGQESPKCVFVGALDYRANVDGIGWFLREVWPGVVRRRPGARFALVGANPGPAIRRLAQAPAVELIGEVPDVRPHLAAAAVSVVPLRVARGVQNKVLESLASGKAVIASPQAIEGLALEPGLHLYQAASAEQWVDGVVELLERPDLRQRLGQAGRAQVERHYRWDARLEPLSTLLNEINREEHAG